MDLEFDEISRYQQNYESEEIEALIKKAEKIPPSLLNFEEDKMTLINKDLKTTQIITEEISHLGEKEKMAIKTKIAKFSNELRVVKLNLTRRLCKIWITVFAIGLCLFFFTIFGLVNP